MKKYAVIVAAGSGTRMQTAIPKQFLLLKGKPVIWYTLQAFFKAFADINIILVVNENSAFDLSLFTKEESAKITIVRGGDTRFQSVKNGLSQVKEDGVVFVHDGVRCLVSPALIQKCYEHAVEHGTAIPAVAATDSIRITEIHGNHSIDRQQVQIIQTPQTFLTNVLLPAFAVEYNPAFTDEATVVEMAGHAIFLVEGEYQNIKITRPIDLLIAEQYL
jgi:2-C-methyl-D-erythritol 4-phosphate cytidylyltransferase